MNKRKIFLILLTMVLTVAMTAGTFDVFGETAATGSSSATATATDTVSAASSTSTSTASGSLASKTAAASNTTGTGDKIATVDKNDSYKSGEVLVIFKDTVSDKTAAKVADSADGDIASTTDIGSGSDEKTMAVVETGNDQTVEEAMSACAESGKVEYVQPNYLYRTQDVADPTDSAYTNYSSYYSCMSLKAAWNELYSVTGDKVKVAVIDTGCSIDHEDLQAALNKELSRRLGEDDNVQLERDSDDHGTHVSGIIAATSNNSGGALGVASMPYNNIVDLMVIDATDSEGYLQSADIAESIQYAADNGAKLINMSIGGPGEDQIVEDAVKSAYYDKDVLCICASGNEDTSESVYPGDIREVVNVINISNEGTRSRSSNYGSEKDISAPGESVYSTVPRSDGLGSEYGVLSGTSMSTPAVTGIAALTLYANQKLTARQLKNILLGTATDIGDTGFDDQTGYGKINAGAAVTAAKNADNTMITSVSLNETEDTMYVGDTSSLEYTITPVNSKNALSWSSSDESVASVADNGKITALKAGQTIITAESNGVKDTCVVTVHGKYRYEVDSSNYSRTGTLEKGCAVSDINIKSKDGDYYEGGQYMDGYSVYAKSGDTLTISMDADESPSQLDPYLMVLNSSGEIVDYDDDGGSGNNAKLEYNVTSTGTYYVQATTWWNNSICPSGEYSFICTGGSKEVKTIAAPTASASPYTYNSTKITWNSVSGATGYRVYRYNSSTKKYELRASTGSTAYTDTGLATGTKYYYKVQAYNSVATSGESAVVSARPRLSATKLKLAAGKKKMTLKWKKVSGASGYKIYRAAKKKGKYKKVATIKKGKTVKWTNKKLKKKKKYYYKIKAYRKVSGKLVYSTYSYASRRTR